MNKTVIVGKTATTCCRQNDRTARPFFDLHNIRVGKLSLKPVLAKNNIKHYRKNSFNFFSMMECVVFPNVGCKQADRILAQFQLKGNFSKFL